MFSTRYSLLLSVLLLTACGDGGNNTSPDLRQEAIERIAGYAQNSSTAPTLEDFVAAGVTGVNEENLSVVNSTISGLTYADVDTTVEIQAITDQLNVNVVPTADAGTDTTIQVNEAITLTGSGTDVDGTIASYEWKKGDSILATTASFAYTPSTVGTDVLTLTVTDDDGAAASDMINIAVSPLPNQAPIANAGADTTVQINQTITITGSGEDTDGTISSYQWKKGDSILASTASFDYTPTTIGTDTLTFTVTDNDDATDNATINVVVTPVPNRAPTANAGDDQADWEGATFNLSGLGTDPDNDVLNYSWAQTDSSGITVTLTNADTNAASFTAPEVEGDTLITLTLTVNDGFGGITTDVVDVSIKNLSIEDTALKNGCFGYINSQHTLLEDLSGILLYKVPQISCGQVDLSSADFSELAKLTSLTYLYLSGIQITDLSSLTDLESLEKLSLIGNPVVDISPLSSLTGLRELILSNNEITDMSPLSQLIGLRELDLSGNEIVNLSPVSNLTSLSLRSNQIVDLSPISSFTDLLSLDLTGNRIGDLSSLSALTGLLTLSLGGNQITDVNPLSDLVNLRSLNLSSNDLAHVSPLSSLIALTSLDLSDAQISNVNPLSSMTRLTSLDLGSNGVIDVSPLSGLTRLTSLSLGYNLVIDISHLTGLTNLTYLHLINNRIEDISSLSSLIRLKQLDLRNNKVVDINPLSGFSGLTRLSLDDNCIVDFTSLPSGIDSLSGTNSQKSAAECMNSGG